MNAGESKELQKKGGCSFLGRAAVPSAAAGKRTPSDAPQSFTATASEFREKGNFESLEKEPGTCGSPRELRGCSGVELSGANKGSWRLPDDSE